MQMKMKCPSTFAYILMTSDIINTFPLANEAVELGNVPLFLWPWQWQGL